MDWWFPAGIGLILAAGLVGGSKWLNWRVQGLPWPVRRQIAQDAAGTFFLLACLWGVWFWASLLFIIRRAL